jgi:hypothetical protein
MCAARALLFAVAIIFCAQPYTASGGDSEGDRYILAASRAGVTPLHRKVYLQLAQLHRGDYWVLDGSLFALIPSRGISSLRPPDDATARIYEMGIDVLPVLTEALDDTTPSQVFLYDSHRIGYDGHNWVPIRIRAWKVNELVGMLICAIAERRFVAIEKGHTHSIVRVGDTPALVPRFQRLVLDWYAASGKKTPTQRKVEEVSDEFDMNRLNAIAWLGYHKEKAGEAAIQKNVEAIFAAKRSVDSRAYELAAGAFALGQIGDSNSMASVRRICGHFSRRLRQNGTLGYGCQSEQLFTAYRGLALLGKKDEALKELDQRYSQYSASMGSNQAEIYKHDLEGAQRW